ncbi:MAG: hypothetical protein A2138_24260 [Deltaproteobacteria bacterium RBG_16_71_12]|nr:MAG: hypothetical protein A2138_24260 [Deltaproteobacteria bacterium RBG_16_71_12]
MIALVLQLALAAPGDAEGKLEAAAKLAARQEHAAAFDAYRALLDQGIDGRDLRYNLGTLALELDRLGEAVLHLRTARRFDPRDDDVRHNLEVALARRTDRLAGEASTAPLFALGEAVPPAAARFAFALPLALLGAALCARGALERRWLSIVVAALTAIAAVGGAVWLARRTFEATREAVVLAVEAPAFKEPNESAATAFTAHAGLWGRVVDEEGAFVRVRLDNGLEVWLARAATAVLP